MITRRDVLGWLGLSFMAGNDAAHPFQEDFLQTIKEVHWGEKQDFLVGGNTPVFRSGSAALFKSKDGKTFTDTPSISKGITGVAYTDGVWALSTKDSIYTSSDLASWTTVFSSGGSKNIYIAAGKSKGAKKGVFVAAVVSTNTDTGVTVGSTRLIVSADAGKTWQTTSSRPSVLIHGMNFANGLFFATGGYLDVAIIAQSLYSRTPQGGLILTSSNGKNWSSASVGSSVPLTGISDIEFACPVVFGVAYNPKTKTYCAVANEPFGYVSTGGLQGISAHLAFYTSTDGRRWGGGAVISNATSILLNGPSGAFLGLDSGNPCIAYGNGTFVALGYELRQVGDSFGAFGAITLTSGNGSGWSQERVNLGQDILLASNPSTMGGVIYSTSAKQFVLCGTGFRQDDSATSTIFHSSTGKGWITAYQEVHQFGATREYTTVGVGKLPKK